MENTPILTEKSLNLYLYCPLDKDKFNAINHQITENLKGKKVLVYFDQKNWLEASMLKMMFDKHRIASFVISTDLHKSRGSAVAHQFNEGNLDCLIMLNTGYSKRPNKLKNIDSIFFFDLPRTFNEYKAITGQIDTPEGQSISLVGPEDGEKLKFLNRKYKKHTEGEDTIKSLSQPPDAVNGKFYF